MDALLWISMLIGMYIGYLLVVKLKYKEVVFRKGDMKFSMEYVYTFLAISVVFISMMVAVVSWIGTEFGTELFLEATIGNCIAVAVLAGMFVVMFQDQVRLRVDMYLKEKKNILDVSSDVIESVKEIEEQSKKGL